ncbi:hypothetical protein [Cryptosporangium sp. NPDC051539]|uniref:hypothetical protein n=1 Tax=Cryptosporangium sp. NPDC051539 TaxID=3363962 RepID=UPI0037B54579
MFTRLSLSVATAVALAAALSGCGTISDAVADATASASPSPSPTEAREGRVLTSPEAKSALPVLTDLTGSGWKPGTPTADDDQPSVTPAECAPLVTATSADFPDYKSKLAVREEVTFTNESSGYTDLNFEVASWTNAADSALPIDASALIDKCTSTITGTYADGTVQTITAKRLTPLPLGDKQVAMQFYATNSGVTVYLSVFEATFGHNLITAVQTSTSSEDPQKTFEPVINGIIADLSA